MSRDGWSSARSAIQAKAQPSLRTDRLGRPVSRSGDAFAYNPRGEVTNAVLDSAVYRYAYDHIGNRQSAYEDGVSTSYSANEVNQYTEVGNDEPEYDDDGNLVDDGTRTFEWSAAGHLTEAATPSARLSCVYDHLGRRVSRTTETRSGFRWNLSDEREYVYDDWNLIHETRSVSGGATDIEYYWGPDLSGSLQGAGGVGGLVAVSIDGDFYFPGYDNNGNVIGYWNETGSLAAEYAYDAFGNKIASSGSMAAVFPHRFSTKYYDAETDLYYYGYRYYSPALGRWISRDPIGEDDFSNLFLFCNNSPTSFSDLLGTRMLGSWPASTNRDGWAFFGIMNFPGAGYSGEFRTRPTSFFDLAAKIHDLHYMINGLNFTGEGLIPWRHRSFLPWNWDEHNKDPRISRLAKADFIFKKMNEAKWDAGWWSGTLNYLSRRVFFDDPKHFCKGDDFTNFLKAEQSFELNDPSKFLMIPYSRLSVPPVLEETYTYRKYHPPRNPRGVGVGRWTTETETRIVPDYLASAPEDSSPGFFSWAEQTYGTTWTRIQSITEDTDYTFQW